MMISTRIGRVISSVVLMGAMIATSGCATTDWSNPDASKDLNHDLAECNYNTMKSVCNNTGASVATNCSTSNGTTTCKPAVIPASNACHDELQLGPRDACMQELGWVKSTK
jgi:hypothetical protein